MFFVVIAFSLPTVTFGGGMIPCGGTNDDGSLQKPCQACHVVQLGNKLLEWFIMTMASVIALIFAWAGMQMVMSAGNTEGISHAKAMMTNSIIGLIILLSAWLVIDTIMKIVIKGNPDADARLGVWHTIKCVKQPEITSDPDKGTGGVGVTPSGNLVTYAGAQFDSAIVDKIKQLDDIPGLTVSGGYRTPERNAQVNGSKTSNHLSGRAGDFSGSPSALEAGRVWALANGAKEVLVHNAGSGTHLHVAW